MTSNPLTAERLRELLHYDPDTGVWTWLDPRANGVRIGDAAGWVENGRRRIHINSRNYLSAPLAWLYMTGGWPKLEIDHRDLDKLNDRWSNLREATHAQNIHNRRADKDSLTGVKGVSIHRNRRGRAAAWRVCIAANGKRRRALCHGTLGEAGALYEQWARELHGDFARVE